MKKIIIIIFSFLVYSLEAANSPIQTPLVKGIVVASSGASFTDDFDRADANPMSDPVSGGTWTSGPGGYNDCQILANSLASTSGECAARVLTPTFAANQSSQGTLGVLSDLGPMVRMQTDGTGYLLHAATSSTLIFYKVTGSFTYTQIGSTITGLTLVVGSVVKFSTSGTTLTAYVDGVSVGSETDSTFATGQPGWYFGTALKSISTFTALDL